MTSSRPRDSLFLSVRLTPLELYPPNPYYSDILRIDTYSSTLSALSTTIASQSYRQPRSMRHLGHIPYASNIVAAISDDDSFGGAVLCRVEVGGEESSNVEGGCLYILIWRVRRIHGPNSSDKAPYDYDSNLQTSVDEGIRFLDSIATGNRSSGADTNPTSSVSTFPYANTLLSHSIVHSALENIVDDPTRGTYSTTLDSNTMFYLKRRPVALFTALHSASSKPPSVSAITTEAITSATTVPATTAGGTTFTANDLYNFQTTLLMLEKRQTKRLAELRHAEDMLGVGGGMDTDTETGNE